MRHTRATIYQLALNVRSLTLALTLCTCALGLSLSLSLFLTSSCYPVIVEYKGMSLAMVYSLRNMAYVPMGFELERISLDVCQLEFPCYVV